MLILDKSIFIYDILSSHVGKYQLNKKRCFNKLALLYNFTSVYTNIPSYRRDESKTTQIFKSFRSSTLNSVLWKLLYSIDQRKGGKVMIQEYNVIILAVSLIMVHMPFLRQVCTTVK